MCDVYCCDVCAVRLDPSRPRLSATSRPFFPAPLCDVSVCPTRLSKSLASLPRVDRVVSRAASRVQRRALDALQRVRHVVRDAAACWFMCEKRLEDVVRDIHST